MKRACIRWPWTFIRMPAFFPLQWQSHCFARCDLGLDPWQGRNSLYRIYLSATRRDGGPELKSLVWAESTKFLLTPISWRSILILSSHLRQGLPKVLFPAGVPVKILKTLLPYSILATWPAHLSLLDLIWNRHYKNKFPINVFRLYDCQSNFNFSYLTNSTAYGTWRSNAAITTALQ